MRQSQKEGGEVLAVAESEKGLAERAIDVEAIGLQAERVMLGCNGYSVTAANGKSINRIFHVPTQGLLMESRENITWHTSKVSVEERSRLQRQNALTIWLTGLSASGKSTLAYELERRLHDLGHASFVLDGDNIRHGLSRDLGFSAEHRKENIRRIAEVARLFNDAGVITITAFISPYRGDRAIARNILGPERFIEVYLAADIEVCERRDPRGLYKKARAGEIPDFTGISAPYEAPNDPTATLDTGSLSVEQSVIELLASVLPRLHDGGKVR